MHSNQRLLFHMLPRNSTQIFRQFLLAGTLALISLGMASNVFAQIIVMPANSPGNPELEAVKLIMETLRGRADVRNISLQKNTYNNKITAVCYEQKNTITHTHHSEANHPGAYADGYGEGHRNAGKGDKYEARSAGGEFSRGYEDGYFGRANTGQNVSATVNDYSEDNFVWQNKCASV